LAEEWALLSAETPLIVAGDFNQDRDGSGWYGTREGRSRLTAAMEGAGLLCLTGADLVETGQLGKNHLIDHICVTGDLAVQAGPVSCWEPVNDAGVRMSDHPGVSVDVGPTLA
jgi:endonuclease/exonuclease/phosphatase family metal-dependent hydrolase